ncbi:hypothetical protein BU17DRAFT_80722 [Hysterangium stoloniferum]|nr:hypothetical protein BU17DRAFT_80722 [Hysterangium stoloniferum]
MSQNKKDTVTKSKNEGEKSPNPGNKEQQFHILPHPAKTNDPRDLQRSSIGLSSRREIATHYAHGPQIIQGDMASSLEQPLSREELRKRAEELNRR